MTSVAQLQRAYCRQCRQTTLHSVERCADCGTALPTPDASDFERREYGLRQARGRRVAAKRNIRPSGAGA